jgi:hypothetical protein
MLASLLGAAGLALVAAAAQLVSAAGSSDLAFVPPGAVGGALAIPWALGGAALLLSPAVPGEGGSPARDFAAVGAVPAGFLVLLRLQESAGGQLPGNAAVTLAVMGGAVACLAAYTARRALTLAAAGRSGIAVLSGVLVSLFGGPLATGGTVLAGLFLAIELGLLAASLFGENALLIADAIAAGHLDALTPAELSAALVTLVAEDRGRDRPQPSRRHFPTPRVEVAYRRLRGSLQRLAALEREHGLQTLRPLSLDYIAAAHQWASGTPLADIETPAANDIGDVVKAMKNLYSMLRQMEQALRDHPLLGRVRQAREAMERDLIRRV